MKYYLTYLGLLVMQLSWAQVNDDFSDGDFTNNPVWYGNTTDFDASGFDLHLNAATAGESYLSTSQSELGETTWEFLVDLDFNLTSSNHAFFYLASDQSDFTGTLNGYYISIGSTNDEISLYKQTGLTKLKILDGTNAVLDSDPVRVRIRVTRDVSATWSVYYDTSGGSTFSLEGSVTDFTHANSSFAGVRCVYTSTRKDKISFDDISISTIPVVESFRISSVVKEGSDAIRITFNQNLDKTSAEISSNYSLNYGFGHPLSAIRDELNLEEVILTFAEDFVNNKYTLNIDQIQNASQDETIADINQAFAVELQTPLRNIVINEIMADPTPLIGLPDAEFIELYNPSDQAINMENFTIDSRTIGDFVLESKGYVTLTAAGNVGLFTGEVIGLSGLALSNGGEALELIDHLGNLVDSVTYDLNWYKDNTKNDGGYSLEQINPELACSYETNWAASSHINGGTPGSQNNVYNNSPDVEGPNLIGFFVIDENTFQLTFDEPIDEATLHGGSYTFDNGIAENGITPVSPGSLSVFIDVIPDLSSGITYTVLVEGVADCASNEIQTNSLSLIYDTNPPELDRIVIKSTKQVDVIFNEALDKTQAESESNYFSNHAGTNPSNAVLDNINENRVSLTFDQEFNLGVANTLTIENLADTHGNALISALTPSFTYSQEVDSLYVIGINLLDILFTPELDASSTTETGNYFVSDDVGHPISAFIDKRNDHLVHLAFAKNFNDNKNLTLSISDLKNDDDEYLITPNLIFEFDTSPPKLDTLIVTSSNTLALVFAEKVDNQSAESKENYEYEKIYPAEVVLENDLQTVILEFSEDFKREVEYELLIDEVNDLYGNEIKTRIKQEFVYDVFAPQLDSIIVRSANELVLWFNENVYATTAENSSNYAIGETRLQPSKATFDMEFQHLVYLNLTNDLPEITNINLEITTIKDQRGNSIASPIFSSFDYDLFYVGKIDPISQNHIRIEFNKTPHTNSKNALSNYKLNGEAAQQIEFEEGRVALLTFATEMEDNSINGLTIENIGDLHSNALAINDYSLAFDSRFLVSYLIGDRTVAVEFEQALHNETLPLTNFTSSPSLGNCVAAVIDSEKPQILKLTFEQSLVPDVSHLISWRDLKNAFDHSLPDYFTTVLKDQTPPSIKENIVLDQNTLWIKFSEPLNENSAEFIGNYRISPTIGQPFEAKYSSADSSVLLEFSSVFHESINYKLQIDNLEDLASNALFDYEVAFTFALPTPPSFGDLIITEIMADPTPEVGLPDKEYIEIFNTTAETILLSGIQLKDENGSATITSGEIKSGTYLILTSTSGSANFSDVNVVAVTSFPSLNNTGETLSLYADEQQIFSTSYNSDWYNDSDKKEGGWSLEMIDTSNPCGESRNWTASVDPKGGTPGLINSVQNSNPDNFGPQLLSVVASSQNAIEITMNEKIHPEAFLFNQIIITPTESIGSSLLIEPHNNQIEVSLNEDLQTDQSYTIELNKISDCLLNAIQSDHNKATFRLPEDAEPSDLIINEVLFNPRSGGVDFVEIYNNSEKAINLKEWTLGDQLGDQKVITTDHFVLDPHKYLALTTDPNTLIIEYPKGDANRMFEMSSFPSLSNDKDSVLLIDNKGQLIDQMEYQDDYHFGLLENEDGVSLERVSFDEESLNPDNWKSAASTLGFATPGKINSQFLPFTPSNATISVNPQVFIPDNTGVNDYTTIAYQLNQSGYFANVHIYSSHGILVKTLAEGELLSTQGFFTWDGIANNGNLASVGYYLIIFELYDGQGNRSVEKEKLVLGTQF